MRGRIRLATTLFVVIALLMFGAALSVVPSAAPASLSAHPCTTNADCPGGHCCGPNGFCVHRNSCP